MTRYQTAVLENGLRIIALSTTSPVVYCGYQLNVGTANELPDEEVLLISASMLPSKVLLAEQQLMLFNVLSK